MAKYLDYTGLQYFWNKIKLWVKGYINVSVTGNNKTITIDNDGTTVTIQPIESIKVLDTTNETSLPTDNDEIIAGSGEIDLHKISKTGSYNDLLDKPTIPATNVIPATTTQNKVLVSTTTSGTAKWSDWSNAGFLKTNTSGVVSIDTTAYAPLASPALTGTPTAPTATSGTNTTQIATTEFVQAAVTSGTGAVNIDGITGSTINRYGVCTTDGDVVTKTVTITSGTLPQSLDNNATGLKIAVRFPNNNRATSPTLNVNNLGAKVIYYQGSSLTSGNCQLISGNNICEFIYVHNVDGKGTSSWVLVGSYIDTTYTVGDRHLLLTSNNGSLLKIISVNEDSSDRTFQVKGDNTYLTGTTSGSDDAAVVTISHKDPVAVANKELTASLPSGTSAGSYAVDTTYTVLTGVKAQRDAKGHVTGLTCTKQKIKDVSVLQNEAITTSGKYPIILGYSTTTGLIVNSVNKASTLTYNPNTKDLEVNGGTFNGKTLGQGNSTLTTSDTNKIPTSAEIASFVDNQIANAQIGAAMFQGIIKSDNVSPEPTALPTTGYKKGQYWIVGTASQVTSQPGDPGHPVYSPTYAGQVCEVGDTIFCVKDYVQGTASNSDFNIVQNNIDTITNAEIDTIVAGTNS